MQFISVAPYIDIIRKIANIVFCSTKKKTLKNILNSYRSKTDSCGITLEKPLQSPTSIFLGTLLAVSQIVYINTISNSVEIERSSNKESYALDNTISTIPIEPDFSTSLFHDYSSRSKGYCVKRAFWISYTYLQMFPHNDLVGHILTIRRPLITKVAHLLTGL